MGYTQGFQNNSTSQRCKFVDSDNNSSSQNEDAWSSAQWCRWSHKQLTIVFVHVIFFANISDDKYKWIPITFHNVTCLSVQDQFFKFISWTIQDQDFNNKHLFTSCPPNDDEFREARAKSLLLSAAASKIPLDPSLSSLPAFTALFNPGTINSRAFVDQRNPRATADNIATSAPGRPLSHTWTAGVSENWGPQAFAQKRTLRGGNFFKQSFSQSQNE